MSPYRIGPASAARAFNLVARLVVGPLAIVWVLSVVALLNTQSLDERVMAIGAVAVLLVPMLVAAAHAAFSSE